MLIDTIIIGGIATATGMACANINKSIKMDKAALKKYSKAFEREAAAQELIRTKKRNCR